MSMQKEFFFFFKEFTILYSPFQKGYFPICIAVQAFSANRKYDFGFSL